MPRLRRRSCSQAVKSVGGLMISFSGFRWSFAAPFGHPVAHSPQPMHRLRSTAETPFCSEMACTWHLSLHVPQFKHSSGSMTA